MKDESEKIEYCRLLTETMKATYERIGRIHCPALGAHVVFNSRGFHHLSNKPGGTVRKASERIHKLTLVPLAAAVLRNADKIAEERDIEVRERRKKGSKMLRGKTYALTAIVGRKKPIAVRVIILRVGQGEFTFWSIMKD